MAYRFQRQNVGQFQLNAYNTDKSMTLKNVSNGVWTEDQSPIITNVISLITIAGAQSLYPITDSKRVVDERVTETT